MRVIILAAGQGSRLRPYTDDRPKCMVNLAGTPLLHYQIKVILSACIGIEDVALVGGYMSERIDLLGSNLFLNESFASTNMVSTLFQAQSFMRPSEDLIISYGDIVYESSVLDTLLHTNGEVVIAADRSWRRLWSLRMENPLDDAETFIMANGQVKELGKRPQSYDQVHAQYMGLIKVRGDKVQDLIELYHGMDKASMYDGKNFDNMYMTSLIQTIIEEGWDVRPALIDGGWLEIDTAGELDLYNNLQGNGELSSYFNIESCRAPS